MTYGKYKHLLVVAGLLAVTLPAAACETAAERQARLEREAYVKSLDVEELKKQLDTVNPDPYAPKNAGTINRGRFKQN